MSGLEFLAQARKFGMKLGLESMRDLCFRIGNPERRLRFIHLAGTNGKGSTAAFLASVLQEAGFRVGLYTSPHLIELNERIQMNRVLISSGRLEIGLQKIRDLSRGRTDLELPSFFEIMTAVALDYFSESSVDWVVWETGMGGRLDATNVVIPEITVITQIGRDHSQYLGETLEKIAGEKAGILKPRVPLVSGVRENEARGVIQKRAEELGVTVLEPEYEIISVNRIRMSGREWELGLVGGHQGANAACALEVLQFLEISENHIAAGLKKAWWPGRFQRLRVEPPLILDGAHNGSAAVALAQTWRTSYEGSPAHLVFGAMIDKELEPLVQALLPIVGRVTLVRPQNERAAEPALLSPYFQTKPVSVRESLSEIWEELQKESDPILITGSLFLVGEALALHEGKTNSEGWRWNEQLTRGSNNRSL